MAEKSMHSFGRRAFALWADGLNWLHHFSLSRLGSFAASTSIGNCRVSPSPIWLHSTCRLSAGHWPSCHSSSTAGSQALGSTRSCYRELFSPGLSQGLLPHFFQRSAQKTCVQEVYYHSDYCCPNSLSSLLCSTFACSSPTPDVFYIRLFLDLMFLTSSRL